MNKISRNHIIEYIKENGIFSPKQYGFISGPSIVLKINEVLDIWNLGLHNVNYTDTIDMDFQKVFDILPQKRLKSKLDSFNIRNIILNWTEALLTDRKIENKKLMRM